MNLPPILQPQSLLQRRRALRWLAPVGVVGVAGLAATGVFSAGASSADLPATTPGKLIAAVQTSDTSGFSGTVVSHMSLGLPDLPTVGDVGDGTSLTSLLSGSHTMQVWYGGPDKQRVALLGATDETDVFHHGRDVWQWSSADKSAVHTVLPARATHDRRPLAVPAAPTASLTPGELASRAIEALDPTTRVSVESNHEVADRAAYELVLTPRTADTKIGSVHLSIDGDTKVPLGVQVYARGATSPAIDVAFTSIRFGQPSDRNFMFTPPPGATVRNSRADRPMAAPRAKQAIGAEPQVRVSGSGWSRVVSVAPSQTALTRLIGGPVGKALIPVSGTWGSGRLLDAPLLSVLVMTDGRVLAGAVEPALLYTAAGKK